MSGSLVDEFIAPRSRTLGAVRALVGVLADDQVAVVQFRGFIALLEDLLDADEVAFWICGIGSTRQAVEAFLLGLGTAAIEYPHASPGEVLISHFAIAPRVLEVPWEASGRVLGQIRAQGSRHRGGFDAVDEWILRAAGEMAGTVFVTKGTAGRTTTKMALSRREEIVASLVAHGYTNARIATELAISRPTVASHVAHILAKLGFRSRAQIAAYVGRVAASQIGQQLLNG